MGNLILVRHGESLGNRDRIFATDPQGLPLTELGYAQAHAAAAKIAVLFRPTGVFASPYLRAHETARIIADDLHLPLAIEPNLYEREVGELQGRSYDAVIEAKDYDPLEPWAWRPRGGESYEDVQARAGPILNRLAKSHPSTDVVVVSHGGVMLTLWAYVSGGWDAAHVAPNCGIVQIEHGADGYRAPRVIGEAPSARDAGG